MKKYLNYFVISIITSITSIMLYSFFINKGNTRLISTQKEKKINNFNVVDYKGNYSYNAPDFVEAANKAVNTVVGIQCYSINNKNTYPQDFFDPFDFFFGQPNIPQKKKQNNINKPSQQGSGVIISQNGYIITNNHVIDGANKIEVILNNKKKYIAELIGKDPSTDIALLKINENNLKYIKFVDSDSINVGDWVLAVGNPIGLTSTVTAGIVSAKGRSINIMNSNSPIESFIQTDAVINPGNSGGALVNVNGDLIGINTAISSTTGHYIGYGFAVPSNLAKKIVEDIKQFGLVQRGFLGIRGFDISNEDAVEKFNEEYNKNIKVQQNGVFIIDLTKNGSAMDAGIKSGDIIISVNGRPINSMSTLTFIIGSKRPGDKVNLEVKRNNKILKFDVTLKNSKGNTKITNREDLSILEILGADFKPLSEEEKDDFGINYGVTILKLDPQGKLFMAGLRENYIILTINDIKIKHKNDILRILNKVKGRISIKFADMYGRIYVKGITLN